jgi:hypothetical protein
VSSESTKSLFIKGDVRVKEVSVTERVIVILKTFEFSNTCVRKRRIQREAVHTQECILNCHCEALKGTGGLLRLKVV